MANTAAAIKQADLTRALKSALKSAVAAGLTVAKYTVAKDGLVTVYTGAEQPDDGPNPFDERLK